MFNKKLLIRQLGKIDPLMTISFDLDEYYIGDTVVITCTLPNDATGTVTLSIDDTQYTAQLSNGVATFNITGLLSGNKSAYASYPGDSKYNNTTQTGTVSIMKKTFSLLSNPSYRDSYYERQNDRYQSFKLRIPSDSDVDKVYVQCDDTTYLGSSSTEGSSYKLILFEIFGLTSGKYTAYIGYLGDDIYLANDKVYRLSWKVQKDSAPIS